MLISPDIHMFFILLLTFSATVAFIQERWSVEVISISIFAILVLFGNLFPILDADGANRLNTEVMLQGLANESLIAVMALLVMGQALIQTDTLRLVTAVFTKVDNRRAIYALYAIFIFIMIMSAFVNNTPLVVIAIPLVQLLAHSSGVSASRMMIPLSYVAILGGMTTVIGSSTNLLVSSKMVELGFEALDFFGFIVPGSILAGVGFLYVAFILPHVLKDRGSMATGLIGSDKEFMAELEIAADSKLIGTECKEGQFGALGDLNVRMIQRGGQLLLPPFDGYKIAASDVLIGAANRKVLSKILASHPGSFLSEERSFNEISTQSEEAADGAEDVDGRILAEIMITPASRCIDQSMEQAAFDRKHGLMVLGIQRRARIVRRRLGRVRLEAGDVLLVAAQREKVSALRNDNDFIILSGSMRDLMTPDKAPMAAAIFLLTIIMASFGVLSIPVAAITGAVAMVALGCLNVRQALRAIDRKIYLLVSSMLALGTAMQITSGVDWIASMLLAIPIEHSAFAILSGLFLLVAILTNLLSNNACAVLFTPIALNLAESIQVAPQSDFSLAYIFAITVVFGANCSFASPIGYQTNLLVMGPGHYRFSDFIRAGIPLVVILWVAYMGLLKFYFGV